MTRPLRIGDSVTIKCEVQGVSDRGYVHVYPEGLAAPSRDSSICVTAESATFITPAEPPVGGVVVKDGHSWVRETGDDGSRRWWSPSRREWASWDDLSDGDIIFPPGGVA